MDCAFPVRCDPSAPDMSAQVATVQPPLVPSLCNGVRHARGLGVWLRDLGRHQFLPTGADKHADCLPEREPGGSRVDFCSRGDRFRWGDHPDHSLHIMRGSNPAVPVGVVISLKGCFINGNQSSGRIRPSISNRQASNACFPSCAAAPLGRGFPNSFGFPRVSGGHEKWKQ